jgi:polyisoprenoid-binding protein YceI
VFVSSPAWAAPVTYELDPLKTELIALTQAAGLPGVAHPHVISATSVTGAVVFDADAPAGSSVTVSFPTDGLRNDDPELRKREGMDEMSQSSREGAGKNMREEGQLNPKLFPTIAFKSTQVRDLGHGQLEVTG